MPRRKFVCRKEGIVEITREEDRALCEEIHLDAAERSQPLECGTPGSRRQRNASTWPRVSDTMAINPEQIPQELAELKRHGVDCEYDIREGSARPILRDQAHKNRYQAALNYADADAGYSGLAPKNFSHDDYKNLFRR